MGAVPAPSPVGFGPVYANNLQPGELLSNGALVSYNGPKNYISYGNFENGLTTGVSLGNVGTLVNGIPSGLPTFGSGASANLSIASTATNPLLGTASLAYVSTVATTLGDMIATQVYNIDIADQAKVLTFRLAYQAVVGTANVNFSGTLANSFGVAVYDVTNSSWLTLAGNFAMTQGTGVGTATGTCQTNFNTTQICFVIYNANPTAGAVTMYFDDMFLGPQATLIGAVVTDWVQYTPTITGFGTIINPVFQSRRVGDTLEVHGTFTGGTSTATPAQITLGYAGANANVVADISKLTTQGNIIGFYALNTPGAFSGYVSSAAANQNYIQLGLASSTTTGFAYANGNGIASNTGVSLSWTIPILGWSSNVQMSSSTSGRVVAANATIAGGSTSLANTGLNKVIFNSPHIDTVGGYDSANSWYIVQESGFYNIFGQVSYPGQTANSSNDARVYIDGFYVSLSNSTSIASFGVGISFQTLKQLNAGQKIEIFTYNSGNSVYLRGDGTGAEISVLNIEKMSSGSSVIAASERICATYGLTTNQSVAANAVIKYDTKVEDTHGCFSISTGLMTANFSGKLTINVVFCVNSAVASIYVKKNGTGSGYIATSPVANYATSGTIEIPVLVGDTVGIYSDTPVSAFGANGLGYLNQVTFKRST